jgi:hypothetical protein
VIAASQRPDSNNSVRCSSRRSASAHQRATMSRPRATSRRCVMNQPARENDGRGRNRDESTRRDGYILWKTSAKSSERAYQSPDNGRKP